MPKLKVFKNKQEVEDEYNRVSELPYSNKQQETKQKLKVRLNKFNARRKKGQWVEMEYQELPNGAVFKHRMKVGLLNDKYQRKNAATGIFQTFTFMKSQGPTCFILSDGMDQGTMVDLDGDTVVLTRRPKKILVSDNGYNLRARKPVEESGFEGPL